MSALHQIDQKVTKIERDLEQIRKLVAEKDISWLEVLEALTQRGIYWRLSPFRNGGYRAELNKATGWDYVEANFPSLEAAIAWLGKTAVGR